MFEVSDVLPNSEDGDLLSPDQEAVGLGLRRYYLLHPLEPTPERLQMLLEEFTRKATGHGR